MIEATSSGRADVGEPTVAPGPDLGLAPNPLPAHRDRPEGVGGSAPTRCRAVAALLADPDVRRQVGSAWPLYLMLALEWDGSATGTRDEIGERMGEEGRNVGNWMDVLVKSEIATVVKSGRRIAVRLAGTHMEAAGLPDVVTVAKEGVPCEPNLDDRQRGVLRLLEDARAVNGSVEIRIKVGEE